ncbi:MAG: Rieske (2Fe-2S) protein [Fulvivirga sp.]|nr:Rieske (2Fe-2S) protein [Fulvivirga sp.]
MKWLKVFDSKEKALEAIPQNGARLLKIGERRISLANYQGNIYATDNKCPHNGEALSQGKVNYLGEIICPWHNYRYSLKNGRECQQRTEDVETYPISEKDDGLYIGIPE